MKPPPWLKLTKQPSDDPNVVTVAVEVTDWWPPVLAAFSAAGRYCPCAGACHRDVSPCSFDCLGHHAELTAAVDAAGAKS